MENMRNKNYVFIARSLDGYIADKNGAIDFLHTVPNPGQKDLGYNKFLAKVEAIVMGRVTFETVLSFNIPWPYTLPVFVVSNSLKEVADEYKNKVEIVNGTPQAIIGQLNKKGYTQLYIDGGTTIQSFLKEDLIDELTISTIPVLLGGGIPLFGALSKNLEFAWVESEIFLNAITQDTYRRKR